VKKKQSDAAKAVGNLVFNDEGRYQVRFFSSLISSLLHSRVNLEWCDEIKLSNLLLPRKSGTIKSLQLLLPGPHQLAVLTPITFAKATFIINDFHHQCQKTSITFDKATFITITFQGTFRH